MKKSVISGLLASVGILYGCATSNNAGIRAEDYIQKGDMVTEVHHSYIDINKDGKFDFNEVAIIAGRENLERIIVLKYMYKSDGSKTKYPVQLTETIIEEKEEKDHIKIIREETESFDYGVQDSKIRSKLDLPKFEEFNPDGKFDIRTRIRIEENKPLLIIIPKKDEDQKKYEKKLPSKGSVKT